jgi:protein CpxP
MSSILRKPWLLVLLATLLVANLGLLAYYFMRDRPGAEKRSISDAFYRDLRLTPAQEDEFRARKDTFMREMRPHWSAIRKAKDSLFGRVGDTAMDDSTLTALTRRIAGMTRQSDERLFRHFRELRKLCTPDQQAAFDTLVPRLVSRAGSRSRPADRRER